MLIERPPQWFRCLFPGALFRLPAPQGCPERVFLTFDDGPIPQVTPWVLDTLDRFGVKATFFMVGQNVERYPRLYEEVRARGHEVGNHTLHHLKGLFVGTKKYLEDSNQASLIIDSNLFRPPHGMVSPRMFNPLARRFRIVMYDLVTRDYSKRLSARDVIENVKRYSRNGSIIVFHDSLKSLPRLKEALPASIEWLISRGYVFETLGRNSEI